MYTDVPPGFVQLTDDVVINAHKMMWIKKSEEKDKDILLKTEESKYYTVNASPAQIISKVESHIGNRLDMFVIPVIGHYEYDTPHAQGYDKAVYYIKSSSLLHLCEWVFGHADVEEKRIEVVGTALMFVDKTEVYIHAPLQTVINHMNKKYSYD